METRRDWTLHWRRASRWPAVVLSLVLGAVATFSGGAVPSGAATGHAHQNLVISTLKTAKFGTVLVSGTTLYTLKPSAVACTATCEKYWPEVLLPKGVKKAVAGKGVNPSKLGTIPRPGGRLQVTYAGRALYWFSLDKAGQVHGNVTDTWGKWSDVATRTPRPTVTTTVGGGGGGIGF